MLGSSQDQFNDPSGITRDSAAKIYVGDAGNARIVQADDITGTNWTTLSSLFSIYSAPERYRPR
jgi:NHL repeat